MNVQIQIDRGDNEANQQACKQPPTTVAVRSVVHKPGLIGLARYSNSSFLTLLPGTSGI